MAISTAQYIDLLFKKLNGVAKTATAAQKSSSNESIASPPLLRGDIVWMQSDQVPASAQVVAGITQGYLTTGRIECVPDTTVPTIGGIYPTWLTNLTDWIPQEFGSTWPVKIYVDTAGAANPTVTGTQIFSPGIGGVGEFFFDTQAGVLNFIGETIPSTLTAGKSIFVVGYRYVGLLGVTNLPSGTSIGNLEITGNTIVSLNTDGDIVLDPNGNGQVVITSGLAVSGNIYGNLIGNITGNITVPGANGDILFNTANIPNASSALNFNYTSNIFSVAGNIIGSNVTTSGVLLATGNITGGNIITLANVDSGNVNTGFANVSSNVNSGNVNTTIVSATGNVNSGNVNTGFASVTGNVDAGNVNTGFASVSGNVNSGNINTAIVSASGNITGGNLNTANLVSATTASITGNVQAGNVNAANIIAALGNISGSNVVTGGNVTAIGNVITAGVETTQLSGNSVTITATGLNQGISLAPNGIGNINVNSRYINNLLDPLQDQDAATKVYVDSIAQGLDIKASVNLATTATLGTYTYNNGASGVGATITGSSVGVLTIDGEAVTLNARVLVKNEPSAGGFSAYNGIYLCTTAGDAGTAYVLTRSTDFNQPAEMYSAFTFVEYGTVNLDTGWVCTNNSSATIVVGTTPIVFTQFSGAGAYTAGNGLSTNGTQFNVNVDPDTIAINGSNQVAVKASANLTTPNIGAATGSSLSLTGNIDVLNVNATGYVSATGNVIGGNINTAGLISVAGNVNSGNINTGSISLTGNVISDLAVTGNVTAATVVSVGNMSGANIATAGLITAIGNIIGGNIVTLANVDSGNVNTGIVSATGNVNAGNVNTTLVQATTFSATANVIGGNITTVGIANIGTLEVTATASVVGNITTTANISGGFILGNGAFLSGIDATSIQNGSSNVRVIANGNITVGVAGTSNVVVFANTGVYVTGVNSTTGNITGGNIITVANVDSGNVNTGFTSVTGNVNSGNVNTTLVSATGNVNSGNVNTGFASITGNVNAGNVNTAIVSASGNITGGNINTTGNIAANGILTNNYYYANGTPVDFEQPAGANTQIQFNNNNSFGASGALVFDSASNIFTVGGNIVGNNVSINAVTSTGQLTISSAVNGNILLDPDGTGIFKIVATNGFVVPVGNTAQRPDYPTYAAVDTGTLRLNSTLNQLEIWNGAIWSIVGSDSGNISVIDQQITPDGSSTAYVLTQVATAASIIVSLNGVVQIPNDGYTVTGNSLTFVEPPLTTDIVDIRFLTGVNAPSVLYNSSGNSSVQVTDTPDIVTTVNNVVKSRVNSAGLSVTGNITGSGNVAGTYVLGNGAFLTGISGSSYGNANVVANLAALGSNPISTTGNITGNYILGNGSQLTGLPATYGNANVATFLAAFGSNAISTTGNITAGNLIGNISITGNVTGTSANVTLVAGSYSYTFDNTGTLTLPAAASGNEGGEIAFTQAANSTLAGNTVVMDNYVDRFRFFESGGNARGAYIDLSIAADGVGTLLNNRASGMVNAGVDVTLGNLRARIPTSGNRSLQVSTVSGSYSVYGSAQYTAGGTIGGTNIVSGFAVSVTTTPAYLSSGNNFLTAGDAGQWIIMDTGAGLAWRISFIIGASFNNNLITIERLI